MREPNRSVNDEQSTIYPYEPAVPVASAVLPLEGSLEGSEEGSLEGPEREGFRERLINITSMTLPFRLVAYLAIAQLIITGLVLLLRDVSGAPQLVVGTSNTGAPITMPTLSFVVSFISMALAWSFLLAGALRSPWYVRYPILLFFTLFSLSQVGAALPSPQSSVPALHSAGDIGSGILVALLLVLWGWAFIGSLRDWRSARRGTDRRRLGSVFPWITFVGMVGIVLGLFSLSAVLAVGVGHPYLDLPQAFSALMVLLFVLLYPIFLIAGTDFAEVSEIVAMRAGEILRHAAPPRWIMIVVTMLLALSILGISEVEVIASFPINDPLLDIAGDVVVFVILGLLGLALAAIGRTLVNLLGHLSLWPVRRPPVIALFTAALAPVLTPFLALPLLARGRKRPSSQVALAGLYFAVVSTVGLLSLGRLFQLPGVEVMIAAATLCSLPLLILRSRRKVPHEGSSESLMQLFQLNLGLLLIVGVFVVFTLAHAISEHSIIILATLVVLAQLWDLLMSGQQITNVNGRRFPRSTRILLYVGYVMLSSTLVLYFASSPDMTSEFEFDIDAISQAGLAVLGIPLLVTGFLLSISHSSARRGSTHA